MSSTENNDKIRTANGFHPRPAEVLTEGYQPQGSDEVPEVVPNLVSGVVDTTNLSSAQVAASDKADKE
jgi:hypothetical protein